MEANMLRITFMPSANSIRMLKTKLRIQIIVSYIHHCLVAHRNKFPSCQCELLISCGNDEDQRALK